MKTSEKYLAQMHDGIRMFGEYHYFDKQPDETVDTDLMAEELMRLPGSEVVTIMHELAADGRKGEYLASFLLCEVQEHPDEDIIFVDPTVQRIF